MTFVRIFAIFVVLTFQGFFIHSADADPSYILNNGSSQDITEFSNCKRVTNNHSSGLAIFVPTTTSTEWESFYNHAPSGVTIENCVYADMYCWGGNANGVLGDGTTSDRTSPWLRPLVSPATAYTDMSVNLASLCTLGNDGRAYCSGIAGYIGDGSSVNKYTPTAATFPSGVTAFTRFLEATSNVLSAAHCAIGDTGGIYCWGSNSKGQLGDNTTTDRTAPVAVVMPSGVTSFTSGSLNSASACAIANTGMLYCWGDNAQGQLGDGTTTQRNVPTAVTLPSGVTSFKSVSVMTGGPYASYGGVCAIGNNDRAYCWGYNSTGQLGDGTTTQRNVPTAVTLPSGVTKFLEVKSADTFACALADNARVYCWGSNANSQFGNGNTTASSTPVLSSLPPGVTSITKLNTISSGGGCVTGNTGSIYCWGYNGKGLVADGTTTNRTTPVATVPPSGKTKYTATLRGPAVMCALAE